MIIPPVPDMSTSEELPAVILWDPCTTHSQFLTSEVMKCTVCGVSMSLIYWLDGTSSKQPRLLHSFDRIVLLVSAVYGCVNKHTVLAHDEAILKYFPIQSLVPFVLFHRTGFTRDLVDTCMAFIRKGVNFHNMESIILERRWETAYYLHTNSKLGGKLKENDFFPSELAKCPSKCFLANFLKEEHVYLYLQEIIIIIIIIFTLQHRKKEAREMKGNEVRRSVLMV